MHEFSLVNAIIETLEGEAEANGWGRICSVTLNVGAMRQVVPEIMRFAFKVASEGTSLDGADLEIVEIPIEVHCPACGKSWGEEHVGLKCPFCGSEDADMLHGMELDIDSVEVEDDGTEES